MVNGLADCCPPFLSEPTVNVKLCQNSVPTISLFMSPARLSGWNLCAHSTPMCRKGCLNVSGRGYYDSVQKGRLVRATFLVAEPYYAVALICHELVRAGSRFDKWAVRLNGTSDIAWEWVAPQVLEAAKLAYIYDYTKAHWRLHHSSALGSYHLSPSISERHGEQDVIDLCEKGHTPIVVMKNRPQQICGFDTFDATVTDERWADRPGTVGVLAPKGKIKSNPQDYAGFLKPDHFGQLLKIK